MASKIKALKSAVLHVTAKANNFFLSLTNDKGEVVKNISCGIIGIKGSKKKTGFAADSVFDAMIKFIASISVGSLAIVLHNSSLSGVVVSKLENMSCKVSSVKVNMNVRHGGTRLPREKRK